MKIPHKKIIKEVSFKTLLVSSLFFVAIFIFAFLAHEIVGEKEDMFDTNVFHFLKAHTTPPLVKLMNGLSFFGNHLFLIPAYILLVTILFLRHQRSDAINIIAIVLSSTALLFGFKAIYRRHRPEFPLLREFHNYSFPSGHALSSFIFCSILIYLIWKSDLRPALKYLLAGLLVIFSLSIGISRIVLRYHFASDVLAGFALGFAWVIFSFWILKKLSKRSGTGH
jgi:undecaprenyl-diphosphatase